ncbi:MAG: M36 family metallopeptidase [Polyangiales bacterium]
MNAAASAPAARLVSWSDLGQARLFMAADGSGMREALPSELSGEDAARLHLLRYRDELGLSPQDVEAAELYGVHPLRAGAAIYQFSQRIQGLPVFLARAKVVLDGRKNLVSLTNSMAPAWVSEAPKIAFNLPRELALVKAYAAVGGSEQLSEALSELRERDGDWHDYAFNTPLELPEVLDATTRPVLFVDDDRLVSAYHVELTTRSRETTENHAYGFVIGSDDGRVLWQTSLTANEAFKYRVWAEPDGKHIPLDGPIADCTPHPTGVPETYTPMFTPPVLVEMDGFNKHADPWLDSAATYSFGNNVEAYSDRNQANSFIRGNGGFNEDSDYRAEVTTPRTFDRVYDPAKAPAVDPEQIKASITQIFYVNNWLHDYYYDSGFDEAAGNAQVDNLGRGGVANDPLLAEAQDGADNGTANNANMSTPTDGRSPRMQMYVWTGTPNRQLVTEPAIAFEDWLGSASFGPSTFTLPPAELVLSDDGSTRVPTGATGTGMGTNNDACQQPTNVSGKIAVIDRGVCTFTSKVQNAQTGGAVAALILNHTPGHTAPNAATNAEGVTIPVLMLSYEDGKKLKTLMAAAPVRAMTFSRGAEVRRDGTIDNTVVAHEWGHYLHMRLQNGQSQQFFGMSEGWGDFNALFLSIRETDQFPGRAFPISQYAAGGFGARSSYYGIRRAPYSVEYTMNPFTFEHIRASAGLPDSAPISAGADDPMNEAHFVGEIWAQMLFEVYVNILDAGKAAGRPFEESKRRMADYVVAGLKGAPDNPTFVEQRDALLAAVRSMAAMDPTRQADVDAMARGFAKRGLGADAVAPPERSTSLNEAVESFVIPKDRSAAGGCRVPLVAAPAHPRTSSLQGKGVQRVGRRDEQATFRDDRRLVFVDVAERVRRAVHDLAGFTVHPVQAATGEEPHDAVRHAVGARDDR